MDMVASGLSTTRGHRGRFIEYSGYSGLALGIVYTGDSFLTTCMEYPGYSLILAASEHA